MSKMAAKPNGNHQRVLSTSQYINTLSTTTKSMATTKMPRTQGSNVVTNPTDQSHERPTEFLPSVDQQRKTMHNKKRCHYLGAWEKISGGSWCRRPIFHCPCWRHVFLVHHRERPWRVHRADRVDRRQGCPGVPALAARLVRHITDRHTWRVPYRSKSCARSNRRSSRASSRSTASSSSSRRVVFRFLIFPRENALLLPPGQRRLWHRET